MDQQASPGLPERQRRIAATIADGIAIQDRFKPEPLLKTTGRGSYRSDIVVEITRTKKAKNNRSIAGSSFAATSL